MKKTWILLSHRYDPWYNLAIEEYLLDTLQPNEFVFYLWQNQHTIVIGKHQNVWRECNISEIENDSAKIARRLSGGGAVYHDLGNINYTFIGSKDRYNLTTQLEVILNAVQKVGIGAIFTGRNDITVDGKKFSGNAFYESKYNQLQHGTIMVDVNKKKLAKFLKVSKKKIESKGIKSVQSRVVNLNEIVPSITTEDIKDSLIDSFRAIYKDTDASIINTEEFNQDKINALYQKYKSWEWIYGKTPAFDITFEERFNWGEVQIHLTLSNGNIQSYKIYSDTLDHFFLDELNAVLLGCSFQPLRLSEKVESIQLPDSKKKEDIKNWFLTFK